MKYSYIDKTAIKRAIKQFPTYQHSLPCESTALEDISAMFSKKQKERIIRERDAVDWMLQTIQHNPHCGEIEQAIRLVLLENCTMVKPCRLMPVSDSTLTRRLRTAYLLVGIYLGLVEAASGRSSENVDGFNQIESGPLRELRTRRMAGKIKPKERVKNERKEKTV